MQNKLDGRKLHGHQTINIDSAVSCLLEKNLIDVDSIVHGNLRITDDSRKNRNSKVTRNSGTNYLLKQSGYIIPADHTKELGGATGS